MTDDRLANLLASNEALGIALALAILMAARANRTFLRDVASDPDRLWRRAARATAAAVAALVVWTTAADSWRHLTGTPYRWTQSFASKRVEFGAPSESVRAVTIVLLGVALALTAALLARHVGGYILQVALLAGALAVWAPLFAIRQRLNVNLAFGFDGEWTAPLDVLGYALFVLLAWSFEIGLILASFGAVLAMIALPVTLLLDLARLRRPRATDEATGYFGALSRRAGAGGPGV